MTRAKENYVKNEKIYSFGGETLYLVQENIKVNGKEQLYVKGKQ